MSRLLLQLFDVTHMFGMHLRPELVLLQKTMVQVEGVARALDPQHDMWAASRPIVERWVKRELGAEGVAKRAVDEASLGFQSMRRLPQTLAALEAAARSVSAGPPRSERLAFQWMSFFIGALMGAVVFLILTGLDDRRAPARPQAPPARAQQAPRPQPAPAPAREPSAVAPIPPAADTPAANAPAAP